MTKLYYTFIALCLSLVSTASLADSSPVFYRVNQVVSGDTVLITADKTVMLHLVGVIAFPPSTPQGSQAKAALSQLVLGQSVAVVVKKQLSNGHWIGQISLGYKDVGLTLLTQGLVFLKDNEMPLLRAMDESNYRSTEKNDEKRLDFIQVGNIRLTPPM
jgi:endonuclease YncB( thermonuclease family)